MRAAAVLDKSEGFSACGGPLFAETRSAMYDVKERPELVDIVYGLGGRDFRLEDSLKVFDRLQSIAATGDRGKTYTHMGQRTEAEA